MKSSLLESSPLLRLAIPLIVGIVMGRFFYFPFPLFPIFAGIVFLTFLMKSHEYVQSALISLCFLVLGTLLMKRQQASFQVEWSSSVVSYDAVIVSKPIEKNKTMAADILLPDYRYKIKAYLQKDDRSQALNLGDGLHICSRIRPNSNWNIGTFDYRSYLETHGFTGTTYVSSSQWKRKVVSLENISYIERSRLFFLKARVHLLDRITHSGLSDDAYAIVAAMTLGDKSALSQDLKDVYSQTGASHVLALSGLHLSIIYTMLSLLTFRRRWLLVSQTLLILSIWTFVFIVGMPVSVVRSALMLTVYSLMALGHRNQMSVNTLAFTAMLMLVSNPSSLFDVGFQLSFLSVFSILIIFPSLYGVFSEKFLMSHPCFRWVWGMTCVSLAAQLGVAPLIAYYFGRFSTFFLMTNFIVVPVTTFILYMTLVVLVVPSFAYLLKYIVSFMNVILAEIASVPGASIEGLHPTVLQVAMVYVIIFSSYALIRTAGPAMGWWPSRR